MTKYDDTVINAQADYDVIIVGAGISGLSAARELSSSGYKVLVLEARNRLGGRIDTRSFEDGVFLDLGASWIHGTQGNPVAEIANKNNFKIIPTDFTSGTFYDSKGIMLPKELHRKVWSLYDELEEFIMEKRSMQQTDLPLSEIIDEFIDMKKLDSYEVKALCMLRTFMIDHPFNATPSELSLFYYDVGSDFPGDNAIILQGYSKILAHLADGIDILLNHPVSRINYEKNKWVSVCVNNDTWFNSKYVIVTVPLGVLKNNMIEFTPSLPEYKIQSVQKLGFGVLNKAYLVFYDVFWDKDQEWIHIDADGKMPQLDIMNYYKYVNKPILMVFFSGDTAVSLERQSDEDIALYVVECLQKIYGMDAKFPKKILVTRWSSENYSRGSYLYLPPGTTPAHLKNLALPIMNKVFFAGEATEHHYCTTSHGAYLSGMREAERIKTLDSSW